MYECGTYRQKLAKDIDLRLLRFHRTDLVLEAGDHAEQADVLRVPVSRRTATVHGWLHPDAVPRILLQPGNTIVWFRVRERDVYTRVRTTRLHRAVFCKIANVPDRPNHVVTFEYTIIL